MLSCAFCIFIQSDGNKIGIMCNVVYPPKMPQRRAMLHVFALCSSDCIFSEQSWVLWLWWQWRWSSNKHVMVCRHLCQHTHTHSDANKLAICAHCSVLISWRNQQWQSSSDSAALLCNLNDKLFMPSFFSHRLWCRIKKSNFFVNKKPSV